jgi:GMP synthase (glutamine-hydrolysing)
MKRAIVLQHAAFEGPARIADLVAAHGYEIETRALHRGDPVPAALAPGDLHVVMGGPRGVGERDRPEYSFLRDEIGLLRSCIAADAPVLGICLGAQLLAHAAGARVHPMTGGADGSRRYEVGWAPVRFRLDEADDALSGLPAEAPVLHWHGDTFALPAGARLLASTAICPNQAFRLRRRIFGLQFHCEVEHEHVEAFLGADADFVVLANGGDGVARLRADTARDLDSSRRVGDVLLRNILRAMTAA